MKGINPTYKDRVRYTLSHVHEGYRVITDPIGWDEDGKEISRHKTYRGVFTKFSNNLEFIEDGAEYINRVRDVYGINAEIRLLREIRHPYTDRWIEDYSGVLDLSEWSQENFAVKVKFNSSGLETELKARESEKVEIERLSSLDGVSLGELKTETINLPGRKIFLQSSFEVDDTTKIRTKVPGRNGKYYTISIPFPLKQITKSDELIQSPIPDMYEFNPDVTHLFYGINDRTKILKISLKGKFTIKPEFIKRINSSEFIKLALTVYKNGSNYDFKEDIIIYDDPSPKSSLTRTVNFDESYDIRLEAGESLV